LRLESTEIESAGISMARRLHIRKFFVPALYLMVVAAIVLFGLALAVMRQSESQSGSEPVSSATPLIRSNGEAAPVETPPVMSPSVAPSVAPSIAPTIAPNGSPSPGASPTPLESVSPESVRLIVPVAGVRPTDLRDTYLDSRSENRPHDAIDIPAAKGTAVLAAADGSIRKLFTSERGGLTLYQIGRDQRTIYYYAHLDRYVEGLVEGQAVRQGEVIAYVGDTGNAGAGNYHLHFAIWTVADPKQFWSGTSSNPYPLLRGADEERTRKSRK
jgi:murein DD-endopeptidase MepM/ murein hydrolase activator NlpD